MAPDGAQMRLDPRTMAALMELVQPEGAVLVPGGGGCVVRRARNSARKWAASFGSVSMVRRPSGPLGPPEGLDRPGGCRVESGAAVAGQRDKLPDHFRRPEGAQMRRGAGARLRLGRRGVEVADLVGHAH